MWSSGFWASGFWADGFWQEQIQVQASLGAWGPVERRKQRKRLDDDLDLVTEAMPAVEVARLRDEMLSASLSADVEARAKRRIKRMAEEAAILLII